MTHNQLRLNFYSTQVNTLVRHAPLLTTFVVAGGPSLKTQDLSCLPRANTIAVNRAFEIVDAQYCYLMDVRLIEWILRDDFQSRDAFLRPDMTRVMPSPLGPPTPEQLRYPVVYVPRQIESIVPTSQHRGMYCGCNSGFGAVQLSVWMGARTVYLLGFDMHARQGTHFHGGYRTTPHESYDEKLEMFRRELESFALLYAAAGISVINLTPDSALTCFPQKNLEEVL